MTDELVKRLRGDWFGYDVSLKAIDAMDEAAERIEALTAERDEARKKFDDTDLCWNGFAPCGWSLTLIDKADTAEAERDRLRGALAFYAYEGNYKGYTAVDPCGCCSSWYEPKIHINGEDSGQIARAALKGETA